MPLTLEVIGEKAARMGASARKTFTLGGTIGRLDDNDWVFPDEYISGHHARIIFNNGAFLIEDTSTNGVFVNSPQNRLARNKPYQLRSGDTIYIDDYQVRVTLSADSPSIDNYAASRRSAPTAPFAEEPLVDGVPGGIGAPTGTDPLALLGLASSPPVKPGPTAASLQSQSPLAEHYRPPKAIRPQSAPQEAAPMPPPKAPPPGYIPDDYDPMSADDDPFGSPPEPRPPSHPAPAKPQAPPAPQVPPQRPAVPPPARTAPPPPTAAAPTVFSSPPRVPTPGTRPTPAEPRAVPPTRTPISAEPPPAPVPPPRPRAPPPPAESPPVSSAPSVPSVPTATAASPPPRPRAQPVAGGGEMDFAAMLQAAGLDDVRVTPELSQQFGQILRVVVAGLMDVLRARDKIKDEFRMRMTTYKQTDNNPLKFSVNVEDALHNLLVKRNAAYLGPVEAFEDAFLDVRNHQMAMLAGVRVAYEAMLAEFDPDRLQKEFDPAAKGANFLSGGAKGKYWELYRNRFHDMVKDADSSFRNLFGDDFAKAYEEQLARLKAANRAERK
jgi:type VI secretion system FHA domain protein